MSEDDEDMSEDDTNPNQAIVSTRPPALSAIRHHGMEKFRLIVALSSEEELHDSYQSIWATVAIIAALFLTTLVDLGYDIQLDPDNMWSDAGEVVGIQLYHSAIGAAIVFSTLNILLCIGLSIQFAHVPKAHTRKLIEEIGSSIVQAPSGIVLSIQAIAFLFALALQFSLAFKAWVASMLIVLMICGLAVGLYGSYYCINMKMRVLQRIEDEQSHTSNAISALEVDG